ncbi:Sytl5p [Dermatophagoides pteronyssinus]|uniref:Sytl5p n=1 Tax=Dermatophagoides pteronyssinus TaxID=6956 RepID=A0ABQ8IUZ5_DERPT|nr:Sytl5p [Dermatophagoides pteronyssinus]
MSSTSTTTTPTAATVASTSTDLTLNHNVKSVVTNNNISDTPVIDQKLNNNNNNNDHHDIDQQTNQLNFIQFQQQQQQQQHFQLDRPINNPRNFQHSHHPIDNEGIYANYNIDYDNDYEQFYDKQQQQQQYLVENSNRINMYDDEEFNPDIMIFDNNNHHQHQQQQQQHYHPNDLIIDDNPYHPIQYFYDEDDDDDNQLTDNNNLIQLDSTISIYQNDEHQTDILTDARTYGLQTFLPQQQQQIQQHILTNGSIYGNPLVYSLHTIYEESENESSLQTLSSITSTSMTIKTDSIQQQQQHSLDNSSNNQELLPFDNDESKQRNLLERQQFSIVITNNNDNNDSNDLKSELKNSSTNTNHNLINGKKYSEWNNLDIDDDDDYVEDEMEEELDYLVDNLSTFDNDSITLSSKLERYFTSGLLETSNINGLSTTTTMNMKKIEDHHQVKSLMNNDEVGDQNHHQQQQHPRKKFNRIECLCNFLNEMISSIKISKKIMTTTTINDDNEDDNLYLTIISKHIDRLSYLFCLDLKRFIIKMILMLKLSNNKDYCYFNNRNGRNSLKAIYSNSINNNDNEFVPRRTWSIPSSSILKNRSSSSSSSLGKTIIKVTVNGRLVPTVENSFIADTLSSQQQSILPKILPIKSISNQPKRFSTNNNNNNSSIRVLQTNDKANDLFRQSKNPPEYRTILHINNQQSGDCHGKKSSSINNNDDDNVDDDNCDDSMDIETLSLSSTSIITSTTMVNKLNKFLRVSNPLNRSFLAKISPINKELNNDKKSSINGEISVSNWTNESIIDDDIDDNQINDDIHPSLISNGNGNINEHFITKRSCSHEQLQIQTHNLQQKPELNHTSRNGLKTNDETKSKVPSISSSNGHRNSFKNFSNSTLDHLYEMFRNPFKSSKKRKKISIENENESKSLSEPNLNGSSSKHKQDKNQMINVSNIDALLDESNDLNGKVFHSKSTPQLMPQNETRVNGIDNNIKCTKQENNETNQSEILKTIIVDTNELNRRNSSRQSLEKDLWVTTTTMNRTNTLGNKEIVASYNLSTNLPSSTSSSTSNITTIPTTVIHSSSSQTTQLTSSSSSTSLRSSHNHNQIAKQLKQPFVNKFSSFRNNLQSTTTPTLISSYSLNNDNNDNNSNGIDQKNQNNTTFILSNDLNENFNNNMAIIGKICLSIYYETKLNSLTITIFRVHLNMIKKNKNDLKKHLKKKTKIKRPLKVETSNGSLYEVEYNEILRFQGKWREFSSGQLSVSIWNNDTFGRNMLLGQTLIRLNDSVMLNSIQTRIWHDLYQPTKIKCQSVHVKGSLFVAIKHEDLAMSSSSSSSVINDEMNSGSLHVLIKEADDLNLTQYNINGYSYCKVMLKPERNKDDRQKTKTVKMGQCPRWNETIVFNNINKIDMNVKELEIAIIIRLTNHEGASNEERNLLATINRTAKSLGIWKNSIASLN